MVDLKLEKGGIRGFTHQEITQHEAIGVKFVPKVCRFGLMGSKKFWIIRENDNKTLYSLKFKFEDLDDHTNKMD